MGPGKYCGNKPAQWNDDQLRICQSYSWGGGCKFVSGKLAVLCLKVPYLSENHDGNKFVQ